MLISNSAYAAGQKSSRRQDSDKDSTVASMVLIGSYSIDLSFFFDSRVGMAMGAAILGGCLTCCKCFPCFEFLRAYFTIGRVRADRFLVSNCLRRRYVEPKLEANPEPYSPTGTPTLAMRIVAKVRRPLNTGSSVLSLGRAVIMSLDPLAAGIFGPCFRATVCLSLPFVYCTRFSLEAASPEIPEIAHCVENSM